PPPEFEENSSQQLVDLTVSGSTELFLIQWPIHQHPEINDQVVTLQLGPDGKLGSFTDSTASFDLFTNWLNIAGKTYDFVSPASQGPDATVILSSESESKIVGKISRRVSLVHYMSPDEYEKLSSDKKLLHQRSSGTLMTDSSNPFSSPMQSKGRKGSHSMGRTVSTHGSQQKRTVSGINEQSKPSKRKHDHESMGSMNQPTHSHETTPISGSSEHSHKSKSKKKVKNDA
ncbi:hypothetical protein Gotri_021814, partial [Gossypium trilobum]|nr:hypothetical protein [Gossypium trilobum]